MVHPRPRPVPQYTHTSPRTASTAPNKEPRLKLLFTIHTDSLFWCAHGGISITLLGQISQWLQWMSLLLLFILLYAEMPAAHASDACACPACQTLVEQEFQPGFVKSCNSNASNASDCEPACSWQLLDIQWCAALSGDQLCTLTASRVSGRGCPYTNGCRVCLESGGGCRVANATGARHPIAPKDAALAAASVGLEIYHAYTIVFLKYNQVGFALWN
jgi:hypothetical protein